MSLNMKTSAQMENNFSLADYSVFASMLFISTAIGIYYAIKDRKNSSNKEFLTANRSLSVFPVAMSLLASFQSSVTILGYPAEMFYRGTQFWLVIFSGAMASIIAAEIFLPVYYKLEFTSINQYLEERFGNDKVRLAVSISFVLCTLPYMGVVLYGPSLALGSVTPLSVSSSVLIIGSICTLYTSIGGIKAVVWTDVVQVFLMFGGLLAVMIRGFYLVGGVGEAFRIANEKGRIQFFVEIDPYSTSTLWNTVFGMGIMWSGNYATSQTEVQRYCNVTTKFRAKLSLYINLIGMVLLISCACLCGVAIFAYYSECDPLKIGLIRKTDQLMPYFVMDQLSSMPGLPGLFVACVFSASLSTLSSGFNALAAVTSDDILRRFDCFKALSEGTTRNISKIMAFCYGLIAIGMAFLVSRIDSVLQAAISIAGALVGPMFGLFFLGVLFPFANTFGVLCGLFSGEIFGVWVLIGSLMYPKQQQFLNTSISGCPSSFKNVSNSYFEPIKSEGILNLYHISYLLVPVFGFIISVCIGSTFSLLSGGYSKASTLNPNLLSSLVWKIWPTECLPTKQSDSSEKEFLKNGSIGEKNGKNHENTNGINSTNKRKQIYAKRDSNNSMTKL